MAVSDRISLARRPGSSVSVLTNEKKRMRQSTKKTGIAATISRVPSLSLICHRVPSMNHAVSITATNNAVPKMPKVPEIHNERNPQKTAV